MRQGQTSPKRPTDADRHCLAAVQNFTQVAVFHSSFTVWHFLYCFLQAANLDWIVKIVLTFIILTNRCPVGDPLYNEDEEK